jgi:predicted GIY-YIG superfamily endonuclease
MSLFYCLVVCLRAGTGTKMDQEIKAGDILTPNFHRRVKGYLYALRDCKNRPFYVGVTLDPQNRIDAHWEKGTPQVQAVLREPGSHMVILEVFDDYDQALIAEAETIARYRAERIVLVNQRPSKLTQRALALRAQSRQSSTSEG